MSDTKETNICCGISTRLIGQDCSDALRDLLAMVRQTRGKQEQSGNVLWSFSGERLAPVQGQALLSLCCFALWATSDPKLR